MYMLLMVDCLKIWKKEAQLNVVVLTAISSRKNVNKI